MPYKSEHIKLPQSLDRRRKLSDADKSEILRRYKAGGATMNSLALEFGCSKKLVLLIVNPDAKEKNDRRIKEHWRDYVPSKEERNRITREHRAYKHMLFKNGLINDKITLTGEKK